MAPASRAAAAKAQKKRQVRDKAKEFREIVVKQQDSLAHDSEMFVDIPQTNSKQLQKGKASSKKPDYLSNPPLSPRNPEELAQLKEACFERAHASGNKGVLDMLSPPDPSVGLRKLPFTPITPPGVAWRLPVRERGEGLFPPGLNKKQQIQYLKNMLSGPSEDLKGALDFDSDEEEEHEEVDSDEEEEEDQIQEDRTISAPVAHRLRSKEQFSTLLERLALMYGAVEGECMVFFFLRLYSNVTWPFVSSLATGSKILENHADIMHGQIAPKNLGGYTRSIDGNTIGVLTDWDSEPTFAREQEMKELKAAMMKMVTDSR